MGALDLGFVFQNKVRKAKIKKNRSKLFPYLSILNCVILQSALFLSLLNFSQSVYTLKTKYIY